jgi:cbb3-type cytochrome oxidase subunit 3
LHSKYYKEGATVITQFFTIFISINIIIIIIIIFTEKNNKINDDEKIIIIMMEKQVK